MSTVITAEEEIFDRLRDMRRSMVQVGETTLAVQDNQEIMEIPLVLFSPQSFDLKINDREIVFLALKELEEIAKGRLTDWDEQEHLGERYLFRERESCE